MNISPPKKNKTASSPSVAIFNPKSCLPSVPPEVSATSACWLVETTGSLWANVNITTNIEQQRTTKNNPLFAPKQFPNKNQKNPVVRLGKWIEVLRGFQQTQVSLVRANHSCRSSAKIISFPSFGQVYTYWIQWRVWHENFPKFPLGEFFRFHVTCQDCAVLRMSNCDAMLQLMAYSSTRPHIYTNTIVRYC